MEVKYDIVYHKGKEIAKPIVLILILLLYIYKKGY